MIVLRVNLTRNTFIKDKIVNKYVKRWSAVWYNVTQ